MFNLPSQENMLDLYLDYKNFLESQNIIDSDIKNINNYNNINENTILKNKKKNSNIWNNSQIQNRVMNIELQISKKDEDLNIIKKKNIIENQVVNKRSEKDIKRDNYQKRKIIATYFHNKRNVDYFSIINKFEKNENYLKYKILHDSLKINDKKMILSRFEFFKYLFDFSSYDIEDNNIVNNFQNKKKELLFHVAKQKLKIDFDIVNILKTIDQFNDFKEIIMDEDQIRLFDFAIKKISNKKNLNKTELISDNESLKKYEKVKNVFGNVFKKEYEKKLDIMNQKEEALNEIFEECMISGPSSKHINLFKSIRIKEELIKEFKEIKKFSKGKIKLFLFLQIKDLYSYSNIFILYSL